MSLNLSCPYLYQTSDVIESYHFIVIEQLKLESKLEFNEFVQKVNLPKKGQEVEGTTILAGWGSTSSSIIIPNMPTDLQRVDLPIVDLDECDAALTSLVGPSPLADTNICTGPLTGGISACR